MTSEDSYLVGSELFYYEDERIKKVEVLRNDSDDDWIRYNLRILEVLGESSGFESSEIGREFRCNKKRGFDMGFWYLRES